MAKYIGILSGKGGVGKSLGYSEYVSLADGDVVEIGPFIDELISNQKDKINYLIAKTVDGGSELFEVLTPPDDLVLDVVHFNSERQSLVSEKRKPVYLMRKPAPETLIRMKCPAGLIDVTQEHKFVIMRHGSLIKIEAKDIRPKTDYLLLFNPKTYGNPVVNSSKDVSELLGYLMGDGYIEQRKDRFLIHIFVGKDKGLLEGVKKVFEHVFGSHKHLFDKKRNIHRVSFCKNEPIKNLFKLYKIKKVTAGEKFVPEKIFASDDECVSAFIRALFDCDAHVSKNRLEIEYVSKSKRLVLQVASLLRTRFGICGQIKSGLKKASNSDMAKQRYWRLYISGENAVKYHKHVSFRGSKKKNRLEWLVNNKKSNTNIDVFPVGSIIKSIRVKNGITAPQIAKLLDCTKQMVYEYEREFYAPSRKMLVRFITCFKKLGVSDEDIRFLANLACSDYSFRRVESVEEISYDKPYVYDFQVCEEGGHFVHASGIVVSNTTTAINLGSALNYFDKDVTVVDGNLTTPNVGLHLGVPVVPINFHHALRGENHITEAVYLHPAGMKIVPAGISMNDLKTTDPARMPHILGHLDRTTDFVIIDGAAGLGREALATICSSEQIIIVTNPELPAIADALKTVKYCEELGRPVIGVVLTRTKPNNLDVSLKNIETILDKPVIGIIPEDKSVREAMVRKDAVVYTHPKTDASVGYKQLAAAILGRRYEPEAAEGNWILKVLNRIGLVKA